MQYCRKKPPNELGKGDFLLDCRAFSKIQTQNSLNIVGGVKLSESKHNRIAILSHISWIDLARIIKPLRKFKMFRCQVHSGRLRGVPEPVIYSRKSVFACTSSIQMTSSTLENQYFCACQPTDILILDEMAMAQSFEQSLEGSRRLPPENQLSNLLIWESKGAHQTKNVLGYARSNRNICAKTS